VSGFVVGMLVGLTGVGGGSLMTPILVLLFGVHATTAVGTDLLYAAITKTGGTLTHRVKGTVDWRVTGRLAAGSIPATILALFPLHILGIKGNASPPLITTALGITLVMTAVCPVASVAASADRDAACGAGSVVDRDTDDLRRAPARGIRDALLGRCRRHRDDGSRSALPAHPDRPSGRLRHRPCRAADLDRGRRPLASGIGRLGTAGFARHGLSARHLLR